MFSCFLYYLTHRYEFKNNHGEWINTVKPNIGPGISERVAEALKTTGENVDLCHSIKGELRDALSALLGVLFLSFTHRFMISEIYP